MDPTDTPTVRPLRLAAGLLLGATLLVSAASACSSPIARVDVYDRTDAAGARPPTPIAAAVRGGTPRQRVRVPHPQLHRRRMLAVVSVDGVNDRFTGESGRTRPVAAT